MLVMSLGGVIWLALEARNPDHYRWLWQLGRKPAVVEGDLDTRLPPGTPPEGDTFVLPTLDGESRSPEAERGTVPAESLAAIRDDQPFRRAEQAAWFQLLDKLRSTDEAALAGRSIGRTTLIQLFRQPDEYRGELVTISGILRRCEEVNAPNNDRDFTSYYQTWVFPDDNPSNPIVVYCLRVPDGFPLGLELAERVELVGFFFKRWSYAARDTVRLAPVVLAKGLAWTPAVKAPARTEPVSLPLLVAAAAGIAAAVVLASWWRTRRIRPAKTECRFLATIQPGQIAEPIEVGRRLRLLAEQEQENDP
ncbi:MAG: hypothetical protein PHO07_03510 [Pirellulales bacterium]|jgi:hypothetical protein|nr:hypothetical protein [Thermoguttaceae bacterium]MDD4786216.1 hypothetical protein [Pirellulales bacterium]MDI9444265.1 hypothetical protein [Planctomycetota bacterium]NLZ02930.1 hypothetical protein [Pirellulaceae bacterium]